MNRAVLLVGHGSKIEGSGEAMNRVISELQERDPSTLFQAAFLEIQLPNIPDGINLCIQQGAKEVTIVPYFVQTGKHVVHDIPRIIEEAKKTYPNVSILLSSYLGFDPRIVSLIEDRVQETRAAK